MQTAALLCCLKLWSHTYTIQLLWRIYVLVLSLCTIQGDYNEKGRASLALSSPKQKLSPCIVALFLWKHCWLQDREWTLRLNRILGKAWEPGQRNKCLNFMCYVIPAAQASLLPCGRTKQGGRAFLPWLEPLLLSVQTRAVPLCTIYGGVGDITSQQSGAV